ncbi:MAG: DUF1345 domain-containing protein [Caulobacteraceae bacterium]
MNIQSLGRFITFRWRTLLAGAVGVAAGIGARDLGQLPGVSGLIGWLCGAITYLVPTWCMFLGDDEERVRRRAGREDETQVVIMVVTLAAIAASLAAIVVALHEGKAKSAAISPVALAALAGGTLISGWLVLQSLFTLHYAHRYFGDRDGDGTADQGIDFPGDPPRTYRDFIYVAICIGATFQVSDFNITHAKFRNLITAHAALAFFFNTMVLAFGINILGGLVGQ